MITVFTPTYNRAKTLERLYESLKNQTYRNFEWLIVDDGSTDYTSSLIQDFLAENLINIRYYYTSNGGKSRAINFGVKKARGDLFFIVDSDDYLPNTSLETIKEYWNSIPKKELYGGITFRKYDIRNHKIIGEKFIEKEFDSTHIDLENKYGSFDKAEVFSTKVLKKYPFPEFKNEKFVPEGFMWAKISSDYKMKYIDEVIYFCEYLEDGYTKNFKKNFKSNPRGFRIAYTYVLRNKNYKFTKRIKSFVRVLQSYYYSFWKSLRENY